VQIVGAEVTFQVSQGLNADAINPSCGALAGRRALWHQCFLP
jgi:hypothetical protein